MAALDETLAIRERLAQARQELRRLVANAPRSDLGGLAACLAVVGFTVQGVSGPIKGQPAAPIMAAIERVSALQNELAAAEAELAANSTRATRQRAGALTTTTKKGTTTP